MARYSGKPLGETLGTETALVDVKVCVIDDVWSGLEFLRRRADTAKDRATARG